MNNLARKVIMVGALLSVVLCAAWVEGGKLMIKEGRKVKFDYTLVVEGQEIDSSLGQYPVEYRHGDGKILPGLAAELEGLKEGDEKTVILNPEEAYGQPDPQAIKELPKAILSKDDKGKVGAVVSLKTQSGRTIRGIILQIKENTFIVNFNHPLAGETIQFNVKILQVQ